MGDWVDDTIQAFGRSIGIETLSLNDKDTVCLNVEKKGLLFFERHDNEVFIYLARKVFLDHGDLLNRALALCHYKAGLPRQVYCGFRGEDTLVFLVKLPVREFQLAELETVIKFLARLHDRVTEG